MGALEIVYNSQTVSHGYTSMPGQHTQHLDKVLAVTVLVRRVIRPHNDIFQFTTKPVFEYLFIVLYHCIEGQVVHCVVVFFPFDMVSAKK